MVVVVPPPSFARVTLASGVDVASRRCLRLGSSRGISRRGRPTADAELTALEMLLVPVSCSSWPAVRGTGVISKERGSTSGIVLPERKWMPFRAASSYAVRRGISGDSDIRTAGTQVSASHVENQMKHGTHACGPSCSI